MNRTHAALLLALSSPAALAQDAARDGKTSFDFSPAIIDARSGTGSTLGVNYTLKGGRTLKTFETADTGMVIDVGATTGKLMLTYEAKGTATAAAERNPRNFLEFGVDTKLQRGSPGGAVRGGLFVKGEADQRFVNKQAVVGFSAAVGKYGMFARNDYLGVTAAFGRVDPKGNTEREKAVGTGNLAAYNRWNAEGLFMIPVSDGAVRDLEFNVRWFMEAGAPAAVQAADLDQHLLGAVRVGLKNDLFVAYSVGTLPFDRKSDNVLAMGFSYKLK
ncbi:MAG: hypothetical protein ACYC3L_16315 [Gemmatimonadaceae bacterium]